jgi:hypothetical protein
MFGFSFSVFLCQSTSFVWYFSQVISGREEYIFLWLNRWTTSSLFGIQVIIFFTIKTLLYEAALNTCPQSTVSGELLVSLFTKKAPDTRPHCSVSRLQLSENMAYCKLHTAVTILMYQLGSVYIVVSSPQAGIDARTKLTNYYGYTMRKKLEFWNISRTTVCCNNEVWS